LSNSANHMHCKLQTCTDLMHYRHATSPSGICSFMNRGSLKCIADCMYPPPLFLLPPPSTPVVVCRCHVVRPMPSSWPRRSSAWARCSSSWRCWKTKRQKQPAEQTASSAFWGWEGLAAAAAARQRLLQQHLAAAAAAVLPANRALSASPGARCPNSSSSNSRLSPSSSRVVVRMCWWGRGRLLVSSCCSLRGG